MILLEIDNEEGAKYIMWWHTAEGLKHTSRNCGETDVLQEVGVMYVMLVYRHSSFLSL